MIWARKNILSLLWVSLLSTLVVIGGFALLFVPGIILSMYLYLTQFTFAIEGRKGMDAVLRSRDLVKGNWWALTSRVCGVYILLILIFILFASLAGALLSLIPEGAEAKLILDVGVQLLGAVMTIVGLVMGTRFYFALGGKGVVATEERPLDGKKSYAFFAIIGLLSMLAIVASAVYLYVQYGPEYFETSEIVEISNDNSAKERAIELRTGTDLGTGE